MYLKLRMFFSWKSIYKLFLVVSNIFVFVGILMDQATLFPVVSLCWASPRILLRGVGRPSLSCLQRKLAAVVDWSEVKDPNWPCYHLSRPRYCSDRIFYHMFAFLSLGYHSWDKFFMYLCNDVTMDYNAMLLKCCWQCLHLKGYRKVM